MTNSERHIAKLPTSQLEAFLESLGPNDAETIEIVEAELKRRDYESSYGDPDETDTDRW